MKITFLVENNTIIDSYYIGEPGLSLYIEDEGESFLFDTGYSDIFIKNAEKMGISLESVPKIVISHGHNDHTGGLACYFQHFSSRPIIVAHPLAFTKKTCGGQDIGAPLSRQELAAKADLHLSAAPVQISPNCWFLGEIPAQDGLEPRGQIGCYEVEGSFPQPDHCLDDSAVVYKGKTGLCIVTGCSHSGICNIIAHAKSVFPGCPVEAVVGGLHLAENNAQLSKTIDYFKENNLKNLYPCHCTGFAARAAIHSHFPLQEIGVGTKLIIE